MRHRVLLLFLALLIPGWLSAQTTSVSATITDSGGQAWFNGTYTFTFRPSNDNPNAQYFQNGVPFNKSTTISGALDGTGSFAAVGVPDNNTITPGGSTWTVQVCSAATFPCFSISLTITGASQNITSQVVPPAVSINLINPTSVNMKAYSDSEITSAVVGSTYYNLVSQVYRFCQVATVNQVCTVWAAGGGPNGLNVSSTFDVMYVNSQTGNDSNDGRWWDRAKATLYGAQKALINKGYNNATIFLSQGNTGGVTASPLVVNGQNFGSYFVQNQDPNYLHVSSLSRSGNIVTLVATGAIPSNTWWRIGQQLSVFGPLSDTSFQGDYTIASVSGSTITWNQTGGNATVSNPASGIVLPFGFVPAPGTAEYIMGQGTNTRLSGGFRGTQSSITSISMSGTTVTVVTSSAHNLVVGNMVRITDVPEQASPAAGTNVYNGEYLVQTVADPTHFTFTLPGFSSNAATQTIGNAISETPTVWFAGGQNMYFFNLNFFGNLPFVAGFSSDWQNQAGDGQNPISWFTFMYDSFQTNTNAATTDGPAEWVGPNIVWYRHKYCQYVGNNSAGVTTDQRAAVLVDAGPGGSVSGVQWWENTQLSSGSGMRIRGSGSSNSYVIKEMLAEGAGQSQPVIDLLPQAVPASPGVPGASTTFVLAENIGASDSGDNPPLVRVYPGFGPQSMTVICSGEQPSGVQVQGPAHVYGCEASAINYNASTGSPVSPSAARQHGEFAGHSNLQIDDLRRSLLPTNVRFANSAAQNPASWTAATGTGIATASGMGPGDAPGTSNANVGYLSCTANNGSGYCAVNTFNASHTFNFGDYMVGGVWAKPTDASTSGSVGAIARGPLEFNGPSSVSFTTGVGTQIYDSANETYSLGPGGNTFQVFNYTRNDGNWQWLWFWWKCVNPAGCGTQTTNEQLVFSVGQPWAFAYPVLLFVSGSQIPPPAAPTVSQVAGGALSQRTYLVFSTYVNARGETTLSAQSTITVSANNLLQVTSPSAATGATGWQVYAYNQAGLSIAATQCIPGEFCPARQNATPINIGTNFTEPTSGLVGTQPGGSPLVYDGARTGNNREAPPVDTTNVLGDSEVADFATTLTSYSDTCAPGTICGSRGATSLSVQAYNGTQMADQFSGADASVKTNACIAKVIANGGGKCDASGLTGAQIISQEIDVGNHAQVPVTLILPEAATWTVTGITNGTSCAIKQFSQSSIIGPGTGGSGGMRIHGGLNTNNLDSLYCTEAAPTGNGSYIRAEGFQLYNPNTATMANGAMNVQAIFDDSDFHDIVVASYGTVGINVHGLVCCGATFTNVTSNGNFVAGSIPVKINIVSTGVVPAFYNLSADHPGSGLNAIQVSVTSHSGARFYNTYSEGNNDLTTANISVSAPSSQVDFYGTLCNDPVTSTAYCMDFVNNTHQMINVLGLANAVGGSPNCINDHFSGKTYTCDSDNGTMALYTAGSGFLGGVSTFAQLPSASLHTGEWRTITDSTAIASEGQNCAGTGTVIAAVFSNGTVWKCF